MDHVELARRIDTTCRLAGTFTLRSGQVSTTYFDKYRFESDPVLLRHVVGGADVHGRTVTLVEDVLTTGGAVRDAARALRDLGASVAVVLCAVDRSGAPDGPLRDAGLETRADLTKTDLDAAAPKSREVQ